MPALSTRRNTELLPFLQAAMAEFAISSPVANGRLRGAAGARVRTVPVHGGTVGADRRAEADEPPSSLASDLGNTETGDGRRFKGRGPIQITGRANYRRFGSTVGSRSRVGSERAAVPDVAFRIAGAFWFNNGLNELADLATDDAFRRITKRINGGVNGLAERRRFYAQARTVLGVVVTPLTRGRARPLPAPGATAEPVFERGAEAIRARVPRASTRKPAAVARKTNIRPATTQRRRAKPGSRGKVRKAAAAPRRRAATSTAKRRKPAAPRSSRRKPRS